MQVFFCTDDDGWLIFVFTVHRKWIPSYLHNIDINSFIDLSEIINDSQFNLEEKRKFIPLPLCLVCWTADVQKNIEENLIFFCSIDVCSPAWKSALCYLRGFKFLLATLMYDRAFTVHTLKRRTRNIDCIRLANVHQTVWKLSRTTLLSLSYSNILNTTC